VKRRKQTNKKPSKGAKMKCRDLTCGHTFASPRHEMFKAGSVKCPRCGALCDHVGGYMPNRKGSSWS
jgi:hypothetical protein